MSDDVDSLIREIASAHGVAVGRDDPIMMLVTVNKHLISEQIKNHAEILSDYKEQIESLSSRWSFENKKTAEKIINASLIAARDAMNKDLEKAAGIYAEKVAKALDARYSAINKPIAAIRTLTYTCIAAALVCAVSVVSAIAFL